MTCREPVDLGPVEETMLVPLYARAVETARPRPILADPRAVEMVAAIDWDFARFAQRSRTAGCALRAAVFDAWVKRFMAEHPGGTVVEVGAGLSTRFDRLDDGVVRWFDLDLPGVVRVRRRFFSDGERRRMLAASVLDPAWVDDVKGSPAPHLFVAETVLVYLTEADVRAALARIASAFPAASIAFDTVSRRAVEHANRDHARLNLAGRFAWACPEPAAIENWGIGLRLVESLSFHDLPAPLRSRLPLGLRAAVRILFSVFPGAARSYRFNRFVGPAAA